MISQLRILTFILPTLLLSVTHADNKLSPTLRDSTLQQQLVSARRDMAELTRRSPSLWGESPLERRTPLVAAEDGAVSRGEFMQALSDQMPMLGGLRDWRNTIRGRDARGGAANLRSFKLGKPRGSDAALKLGAHALPQMGLANLSGIAPGGAASASVVQWGRIQAGSTKPMLALNRAFKKYDELMEDATPGAETYTPDVTWLSARAWENKTGNLELLAARGNRALTPDAQAGTNPEGTVWGGRGQMALFPSRLKNWNLRGEWLGSRLKQQEKSARAWNLNVDGPVAHPFGEARISAAVSETDAGFAPFSDPSAIANAANKEKRKRQQVVVAQDAKLALPVGELSGTASVTAARSHRKNLTEEAEALAARQTQTDELTGAANLRWQLMPRLALTGRHMSGLVTEDKPDAPTAPENFTRRNESDAGVEVKMSRSLAVTLGAGQTRVGNVVLPANTTPDPLSASLRDENRYMVGLQHRTGGGAWNLSLARRLVDSNTLDGAPATGGTGDALAHTISLSAERRFFDWLNLRGGWNWNNEDAFARGSDGLITPATQRTQGRLAEAQISLPWRSRFDVRYQDYLPESIAGGSYQTMTGALREYGAKYLIGAQDGQGGLGFSVEYARRETGGDPLDTWRVGLTYR
ncbi:MAG TPA: hypothetical protein VGB77_21120 [Abditibacteriaceae bacterium]|jgi:hypothetical protein